MELAEFLHQTRADIREAFNDRLTATTGAAPFEEQIFTELVMEHMLSAGMTFEYEAYNYEARVGNAILRLSGHAVSDEGDQLDLFVSLYSGAETPTPIPDAETRTAANQCLRFLSLAVQGRLAKTMDPTNEAYQLAASMPDVYPQLDQIRVYVLTDRFAKAKNFKSREEQGKLVKLEVMDIERLWRHMSAGKPRDELMVSFEEIAGGPLPCVYVPGENAEYDYALTAIPGEALRFLYEKYGQRLLEANVRSFLSVTGKVNKGIAETLRKAPDRFMAYNNGIVVVADEMILGRSGDGAPGIAWLKGMQIVNGGQTTASLYFTKRKAFSETDLSRVRVPAKVIVLKPGEVENEEKLISDISRYANSQNVVKASDLAANRPFHVRVEQLAETTYCPDGMSRWFYERAAGSYNTMLARKGTTPAQLKKLKTDIPSSRKITKTDLAKYLNAWERKPHHVSWGAQKNFERFMAQFSEGDDQTPRQLPDVADFKKMIAMAIIFKTTNKLVRPMFQAFQANVTAYTVAMLSLRLGSGMDLDKIWLSQAISGRLQEQIQVWAREVNASLHASANGRMISEWAKRDECWAAVKERGVSYPISGIPEVLTPVNSIPEPA